MKIGRVVGTVVSTINSPIFDGRQLRLVDLVDTNGNPQDGYLICVDVVGSAPGETVLILDEGNSARQIVADDTAPLRSVIVGKVDEVVVDGVLTIEG